MEKDRNAKYFNNLLKQARMPKKQVAVYLDDETLERLDLITRVFAAISDSKSLARNNIIEKAVDKFLKESEEYLKEEHGINMELVVKEMRMDNIENQSDAVQIEGPT